MLIHNDKVRLMISAAGIFICYFYFGVFQEVITRGRYGNEDGKKGERFTFTLALVGVQCFFNWLFAKGINIPRHLSVLAGDTDLFLILRISNTF